MYQKEIIYMSLYRNGVKESCVGYLKQENKQEKYQLDIQVKNIPGAITGNFPIRLQSETGWQEADTLTIQEGNGRWLGTMKNQIFRVEIILPNPCQIKGQSKKALPEIQLQEQETETRLNEGQAVKKADEVKVKPIIKMESDTEEELSAKKKPEGRQKPIIKQEFVSNAPLYEDKWEQLLTTYEQIHPYGDHRVYVKLEPKDFVILRSNYQHLVNNSFLLHGFYNYRYLILGKEKEFYLGVPGVFYEREKMVALMFGFEAFECEGGETEEGKFGYYLRRVEL